MKMSLQEYIKARHEDRNAFWRLDPGDAENLLDEALHAITRLRLDAVDCHQGRDVLESLYEAHARLPICGTLAIVGAAIQEIQALRDDREGR